MSESSNQQLVMFLGTKLAAHTLPNGAPIPNPDLELALKEEAGMLCCFLTHITTVRLCR